MQLQQQQHLNIQHHELIKQLKLVQRQYLLSQGFIKPMDPEFHPPLQNIIPPAYFHNVLPGGEEFEKEDMTFKLAQFEHNRHEQSLHVQFQAIQRGDRGVHSDMEHALKGAVPHIDYDDSGSRDKSSKVLFRSRSRSPTQKQQKDHNFELSHSNCISQDNKVQIKKDIDERRTELADSEAEADTECDGDVSYSPQPYMGHKLEVNNNQNAFAASESNEPSRSSQDFRLSKSQFFQSVDECSKDTACGAYFHSDKNNSLQETRKSEIGGTSNLAGDPSEAKPPISSHNQSQKRSLLQEPSSEESSVSTGALSRKLKGIGSSTSSSNKRYSSKDHSDRIKSPTDEYIPISPISSVSNSDTQVPLLTLLPNQFMEESVLKIQQTVDSTNANISKHPALHRHSSVGALADINGCSNNIYDNSSSKSFIDSSAIRSLFDSSETRKSFQHPLYAHGVCRWPGCELVLEDIDAFASHLNSEHSLDDRSTAQARVQMQVVSQLELHLQKERDRLQAMMHHLYLTKQFLTPEKIDCKEMESSFITIPQCSSPNTATNVTSQSQSAPVTINSQLLNLNTANISAFRKRISDKSPLTLAGGLPYMLERAGLDVQQEIQRNREFYKNADVRPPFTYASLIRQSIIESPDKQLTLNEIYNWFQNTFCYFRRNAATWKNAIRTNLSLHKCFVRYEDDFGSFWMVDDSEFIKRRHLSRGRPRKYEPSSSPNLNSQHCSEAPHLESSADNGCSIFINEQPRQKKGQPEKAGGVEINSHVNENAKRNHMNRQQCVRSAFCKTSFSDKRKMDVDGGIDGIDICEDGLRKQSAENPTTVLNTNDTGSVCIDIGINADGDNINIGQGFDAAFGVNTINGYISNNYLPQNTSFDPLPNSPSYGNGNFAAHMQNVWTCAPPILDDGASLSINSHIARHTFESFRNCTRGLYTLNRSERAERDFS